MAANACTTAERAISSLETHHNIIYRRHVPDCPGTSMLDASLSIFQSKPHGRPLPITTSGSILTYKNYTLCLTHNNGTLKGLNIFHLYDVQGFKSFYKMHIDFELPHLYLFYYYQLRHAVCAHFSLLDTLSQYPRWRNCGNTLTQLNLITHAMLPSLLTVTLDSS